MATSILRTSAASVNRTHDPLVCGISADTSCDACRAEMNGHATTPLIDAPDAPAVNRPAHSAPSSRAIVNGREYPPHMRGDADESPERPSGRPWDDPPDADPPPHGIIARPASAYTPTPVDWLWRHRIPRGTVTILDGDPGLGKSTIMLDLAARVSRGAAMPPDPPDCITSPAAVVILSAEDDPARTIRPRLEAAGADLDRVHVVDGIAVGDSDRLPILPLDLPALQELVERLAARLIVVDPLMAYLGDATDSHKDQSIRFALRQFARLAERTQTALVIVRHLNKLTGSAALYRGGGSIGIIGAARSALLLARHPDSPDSRVLASTKSNLGPPPRSIVVSLASAGPVAVAAWGDEIDMSADELLGAAVAARRIKVDECAASIIRILEDAGGRMKSADLDADLDARGYRERTRKSARKSAGVRAIKDSMDGAWWTELPATG